MKITRPDVDIQPFAGQSRGEERTAFGSKEITDALEKNLNTDFQRGWGIVPVSELPTMQDFNAVAYTISALVTHLYQNGIAEYAASQTYNKGAWCLSGGEVYTSLTDNNQGKPVTDKMQWVSLKESLLLANITQETGAATDKVISQKGITDALNKCLTKNQNGADIQNKDTFIKNIGLGELHRHFIVTDKESHMLSTNKKLAVLANDNKTSGAWDEELQRMLWAFNSTGTLIHGTVPVSLVSGAGTAATRNVGVGDGQVPDMSYFPISGKGSDSVVTSLPNGLILQCFSRLVNNSLSIGQSTDNDITFPAAFPTRVLGVFISKASYPQIAVSAENQSLTGFNAKATPLIGVGTQASVINIYVLGS